MKSQPHSLIIGGTRGLGRALADSLCDQGHQVSIVARRSTNAFASTPALVRVWKADLLHQKKLGSVLKRIAHEHGDVDNLIFVQRFRGPGDNWDGEMKTSIEGTRFVIDHLAKNNDFAANASIVMVSSVSAWTVTDEQPLGYHVAKAALVQMARYYAAQLGKSGIRVNSVSPCTFMKEESKDFYLKNKKRQALYKKMIPLRRMGTADDVVNAINFLCSPQSSYITGQNIVIDGGLSIRWQESVAHSLGQ